MHREYKSATGVFRGWVLEQNVEKFLDVTRGVVRQVRIADHLHCSSLFLYVKGQGLGLRLGFNVSDKVRARDNKVRVSSRVMSGEQYRGGIY